MLRRLVAISLICALVWPHWSAAAHQQPPTAQSPGAGKARALARLDRAMTALAEAKARIDRSTFDLNALLARLDASPDAIIDFVTTAIAFEQYPGSLRGAQGTLMSRAGNALDQAVLLATLLKDAGLEARIVEGRLARADAARLVRSMFDPRDRATSATGFDAGLMDSLAALGARAGLPARVAEPLSARVSRALDVRETDKYKRVASDAERLRAALADAGVQLGHPIEAELIEEARDYFWVEHRAGPSQPWNALHPAFGSTGPPGSGPEVTARFAESIPARLQHRLRFRVVVDQRLGTRIRTHEVVAPWERPVANLVGVPLSFTNVPNTLLRSEAPADIAEALRTAEFYAPVFNQARAGTPFDVDGNVVPLDALAFAGAGVLRRVGKTFGTAAGALAGLGGKPRGGSPMSLAGQRIEYTLIAPGGRERTFSRTTFDGGAVGADPAAPPAARVELLQTALCKYDFMVAAGDYPAEYVLDRVFEGLLSLRPLIEAALRGAPTSAASNQAMKGLGAELPALYAIFDLYEGRSVRYRREPGLLVLETRSRHDRTQLLSDIVTNRQTSFRMVEGQIAADPIGNVEAGIWETRTEGSVHPMNGGIRLDSPDVFDSLPGGLIVLTSASAAERAGLPATLRDEIAQELADGAVVIVPSPLAPQMHGYWTVDRATGATVGRALGRRGVSLAEYIAISFAGAGIAVWVLTIPCLALTMAVTGVSGCGALGGCVGLGFDIGAMAGAEAAGAGPPGVAVAIGFVFAAFALGLLVEANCPGWGWL